MWRRGRWSAGGQAAGTDSDGRTGESPLGSRTGQRAAVPGVRHPEETGRPECAEGEETRDSRQGKSLRGRARGRMGPHGRSAVQRRLATPLRGLNTSVSGEIVRRDGAHLPGRGEDSIPLFLRLYGPRFTPFFRSFLCPSTQVFGMPYLIQRSQGRLSSQRLHAVAQFVHLTLQSASAQNAQSAALTAILTCFRFGFDAGAGGACDTGNPNKMTQAWSRRQHRCHTWWVGRVVEHTAWRVRVDERGTLRHRYAIRAVRLWVGAVGWRVGKEMRLIRSWRCWRRRESPPGEMRVGVRNHRRRIWLILGRRRLRLFRGHG